MFDDIIRIAVCFCRSKSVDCQIINYFGSFRAELSTLDRYISGNSDSELVLSFAQLSSSIVSCDRLSLLTKMVFVSSDLDYARPSLRYVADVCKS